MNLKFKILVLGSLFLDQTHMHKLTFFAVQLDKNYHASAFTCLQHCLVLVVQTYIYLAVGKIGNSN